MRTPTDWKNRANHAVTLASGQPLAPGEHGPSDMTDTHDQALRDSGALIEIETEKKEAKS